MSRQILAFMSAVLFLGVGFVPAAAQDSTGCESGFQPIAHAMGETCVSENPGRVVVLDTGELDNALALGASIVGAPVSDAVQYQEYLSDQLDGIADTGAISTPNLEAILALSPDLILGSKQRYEAIYEQLTQIAPTVLTESLRVPWQQNFRLHAEALGKTAEAEQLLANYTARVAEVQAVLGDALDTTTISVIRFRPGQVRLYLKNSYIGYILQDVGLPRPVSQDQDVFSAEISIEEMQQVDADYIFVTGYDVEDSERDTFLGSPLWQTLNAVQNNRVINVNDDYWIAGLGVQAALLVLDNLENLLAPAEGTAAFPVTIEHKFGSTTLTAPPQRVVAIGFTEQDPLLALGVVPVAARYWYGDPSDAIFPWAEDEAGGAAPVVLNMPFGNLNYEAILALQPDLISAVDSGITQEEYEALSQIAPTLAQSADYVDFGNPWQESTRRIGAAVGKSTQAEALIEAVESQFEAARADNPAFAGKTIAVAYNYGEARTYGYYTGQDARGRFFTDLGFVIPDELNEIAGDSFYADLSAERIDLLDQDVLIFLGLGFAKGGREAIESDPLISQLDAVREGRVVYIPAEYDDALQFSTVLSLEYALAGILPELQAAVNKDTTAAQCEAGFRLISHAMGETCVPQNVERVIALEWTYAENLLALGLQPAGAADIAGYNNWLQIPLALDASVADVGTRQEPNLEVIATLQPDLILAVSFRTGQNYELLSAVAPTLVFDAYPVDMTHYDEMIATFTTIAQAVGREAEAEAVLREMTDHFAAAQHSLESAGRVGETFILSQTFLSSEVPTFRLFTDNALAVQTLERIGLVNAWDDAPQQYGFTTVDFEAFAAVDDTNFFYVAQDDYQPVLTASPLWGELPFVVSGRAYWMGGDAWLFGGPLSMQVVVDTVLETMGVELPAVSETP